MDGNKYGVIKYLFALMSTFGVGVILIASIHYYFFEIISELDNKTENQRAKKMIGITLVDSISKIRTKFFQLSVTLHPASQIDLKEEIEENIDNIEYYLNVLEKGGVINRQLEINLYDKEEMVNVLKYTPPENEEFSLEVIDIKPRLTDIEIKLDTLQSFLNEKAFLIKNKEYRKLFEKEEEMSSFLKTVPPLFLRMIENSNRLLYETTKQLEKLSKQVEEEKEHYSYYEAIIIDTVILLVFLLGLTLSVKISKIIKEIKELNVTLEHKVEERTKELKTANEDLKKLMEENSKQHSLIMQQSKLATMGEMINMIAHQWRQPLNIVALQIQEINELLEYGETDKESLGKIVDTSMERITYLSNIIDNFSNFFRPSKTKIFSYPKETVRKAVSFIEEDFEENNIALEFLCNCDEKASYYENELIQVVLNILKNAKDAITENGIKEGKVSLIGSLKDQEVHIEIIDNGGGINPEIKEKIFEPYFSTKGNTGMGLSLFMSKTIIEDHLKGKLTCDTTKEGTKFTITFPQLLENDADILAESPK